MVIGPALLVIIQPYRQMLWAAQDAYSTAPQVITTTTTIAQFVRLVLGHLAAQQQVAQCAERTTLLHLPARQAAALAKLAQTYLIYQLGKLPIGIVEIRPGFAKFKLAYRTITRM